MITFPSSRIDETQVVGCLTLTGVLFSGPARFAEILEVSAGFAHIGLTVNGTGLLLLDNRPEVVKSAESGDLEKLEAAFNSPAWVWYCPLSFDPKQGLVTSFQLVLNPLRSCDKAENFLLICRSKGRVFHWGVDFINSLRVEKNGTAINFLVPRPDWKGISNFGWNNPQTQRGETWLFLDEGPTRFSRGFQPTAIATPTFQLPEFSEEELGRFSMDLLCKKIGPMYGLSVEELEKIEKKADLVAEIALAIEGFFIPVEEEPESSPTAPEKEPTRMGAAIEAAQNGNGKKNNSNLLDKFETECPNGCSKNTMSKWAKAAGLGNITTKNRGKPDVRAEVVAKIAAFEKAKEEGKEEEKKEDVKK